MKIVVGRFLCVVLDGVTVKDSSIPSCPMRLLTNALASQSQSNCASVVGEVLLAITMTTSFPSAHNSPNNAENPPNAPSIPPPGNTASPPLSTKQKKLLHKQEKLEKKLRHEQEKVKLQLEKERQKQLEKERKKRDKLLKKKLAKGSNSSHTSSSETNAAPQEASSSQDSSSSNNLLPNSNNETERNLETSQQQSTKEKKHSWNLIKKLKKPAKVKKKESSEKVETGQGAVSKVHAPSSSAQDEKHAQKPSLRIAPSQNTSEKSVVPEKSRGLRRHTSLNSLFKKKKKDASARNAPSSSGDASVHRYPSSDENLELDDTSSSQNTITVVSESGITYEQPIMKGLDSPSLDLSDLVQRSSLPSDELPLDSLSSALDSISTSTTTTTTEDEESHPTTHFISRSVSNYNFSSDATTRHDSDATRSSSLDLDRTEASFGGISRTQKKKCPKITKTLVAEMGLDNIRHDEISKSICAYYLPPSATILDMSKIFNYCGPIDRLFISKDPKRDTLFSIIVFEYPSSAILALSLSQHLFLPQQMDYPIHVCLYTKIMSYSFGKGLMTRALTLTPLKSKDKLSDILSSDRNATTVIRALLKAGYIPRDEATEALFNARKYNQRVVPIDKKRLRKLQKQQEQDQILHQIRKREKRLNSMVQSRKGLEQANLKEFAFQNFVKQEVKKIIDESVTQENSNGVEQ